MGFLFLFECLSALNHALRIFFVVLVLQTSFSIKLQRFIRRIYLFVFFLFVILCFALIFFCIVCIIIIYIITPTLHKYTSKLSLEFSHENFRRRFYLFFKSEQIKEQQKVRQKCIIFIIRCNKTSKKSCV
jgi:chromate transport protein ChrA